MKQTKYKGLLVVWATHPTQSADDYHSRGRKKHLVKSNEDELTLCNMKNDGEHYENEVDNGMCKSCLMKIN